MATKYASSDDDEDRHSSHKDVSLCIRDQANPDLCPSLSCSNLHMCRDYLLNNRCSEFETNGKCSHSHSLFTLHNQSILKKLKLSIKDREIFDTISRLVRTSENKPSRVERSFIPDDDHRVEFRSKQAGLVNNGGDRDRRSLPSSNPSLSARKSFDNQSTTTPTGSSITSRPSPLTNSHSSRDKFSKSMELSSDSKRFRSRFSIDISGNQFGQQEDDEQNPDIIHSSSVSKEKEQNDRSSSPVDETKEGSSFVSTIYRHGKSIASGVRDFVGKKKEKDSAESNPIDVVASDSQLKYVFNKYSRDDQLSYLLGPIRRYLIQKRSYQIFPSGYCRLANMDQEKDIEQRLRTAVSSTLQIDRIRLPDDYFSFFILSSAAERIFEQNQITYSIISEPYKASFSIEVIRASSDNRAGSPSLVAGKAFSTRLSSERDTPPLSISESKFRIPATNSSIDVICGDITQVKVDLMVCVSTSQTLLHSVLSKAGSSIRSQYEQSRSQNAVLLDGGFTSARNILFISWMLKVKPPNSMETQNSLSDLVKRCIQRASELNMTSIAFPSIGTGQIGLDPHKVCESMISAASERLHKCKMDVLFVIYPSSGSEQKSYQVFRTYLDNLCIQSRSNRAGTPSISHVPSLVTIAVEKSQQIDRTVECKRISTVSDALDMASFHQQVVEALEKLIEVKKFDLSLVQKPFLEKIESLIDICLGYHLLPRIDLVKGDLILRGDRDSCSQCFANLQNPRTIYRYVMVDKTDKKSETKMNVYVSMKIDEAITNNRSYVNIEDNNETIFHIDLKALNLHINDGTQNFDLYNEVLNDSKTVLPNSWSSLLMIRTVEVSLSSYKSMDCVHTFEHTMPRPEWHIERVHAIENWPLYVHYNNEKSNDEIIAFHGCSFSSVQSITHYGLHSNHGRSPENSIRLTRDALDSHIGNARRSTDGKYYMFALQLSKKLFDQNSAKLTNENAHLALPTYLIVYRRETIA